MSHPSVALNMLPAPTVARFRRWRSPVLAVSTFLATCILTGCGVILDPPFTPGSYTGDLLCTLRVGDGTDSASEEFTTAATLTVDADGNLSINGDDLVVGQQVLRSIPTADLAFEIIEATRRFHVLTVVYEPRPTLPGISIYGQLVETYRWHAGSILASAHAELQVTDVSTTTDFTADCSGTLTNAEPPPA